MVVASKKVKVGVWGDLWLPSLYGEGGRDSYSEWGFTDSDCEGAV